MSPTQAQSQARQSSFHAYSPNSGLPTRKGTTTTRQLSVSNFESTDASRDESITRQRALVGNSVNTQQ